MAEGFSWDDVEDRGIRNEKPDAGFSWDDVDDGVVKRNSAYDDETSRLLSRKSEIEDSLKNIRGDVRGNKTLAELDDINRKLDYRVDQKFNDDSRTMSFRNGVELKDGESYSNGNGEYYVFDYDAAKSGKDPRKQVSYGAYEKTHPEDDEREYGVEPETKSVERLKEEKKERDEKDKRDRGFADALSHLEEKFGKSSGDVEFGAEEVAADDYRDVLSDDEAKAFEGLLDKGGNIGHGDRPMHFFRGEDGKIVGYGTTQSMVIPAMDGSGKFAVIPTIKGSQGHTKEMSPEEAAARYRETGKTYGLFDTEDEARDAANTIHEAHQKMYANKWHQYIREHWDEMDESIQRDPGTAEDHDAWLKAGAPRISASSDELREMRKASGGDAAPEKSERGIGEDLIAEREAETGRKTTLSEAVMQYVLPGYSSVADERSRDDQSRYERYMDGTWTDDDLKREDPTTAGLIRNDKGFAGLYGQCMIGEMANVKKSAAKLLDSTYLPWYKKPVSGGVKNFGYTMQFALSEALGYGVAVPAATATASRYGELRQNDYYVADDGSLVMTTAGDSDGVAAAKAIVGGVAEAVIEKYLFDNPVTAKVAKSGVAREIRGNVMRAVAESKAGNAFLKTVGGFNKIKKYTATNGMLDEILEEDAQAVVDDVFGLGKRSDDKSEGSDTLTANGQLEVFLNMFGTMAAQAVFGFGLSHVTGAAKAGREYGEKVKSIYDIPGLNKRLVDNMSDHERGRFLNFYNRYGHDPEKLNEVADRLFGVNGKLEVALRDAANRRGIRMEQDLFSRGVRAEKFEIPVGEDGSVAFKKRRIVDPTGSAIGIHNVAEDVKHGVSIADIGDGKFMVVDQSNAGLYRADSLDEAKSIADTVVMRNHSLALDNGEKTTYAESLADKFGVTVIPYEGRNQLVAAFGEETASQIYDSGTPSFVNDGAIHVILDNVHTPAQMDRTISKMSREASAGGEGEVHGANSASIVIDDEIDIPEAEEVPVTAGPVEAQEAAEEPATPVDEPNATETTTGPQKAEKPVSVAPAKEVVSKTETTAQKPAKAEPKSQVKTMFAEPPKVEQKPTEDREKYRYLPDEYVEFAGKVERGEEPSLKSEYVSEFYKAKDLKYGIARGDDGEFHLVDPDTGAEHDEVREREQNLRHREPYARQSTDEDDYEIPFSSPKKTIPVKDLTLDQVRSQVRKFAGNRARQQRFADDAFVYNEKYRKVESARATGELESAKGVGTLTDAIQRAGHLVEIAGGLAPKSLVTALDDAKKRLVELKASEGGMSGSDRNRMWSIDKSPLETHEKILAAGHLFEGTKSGDGRRTGLFGDSYMQFSDAERKFLFGGKYNDGNLSELAGQVGLDGVEIEGEGDQTTALATRIAEMALEANAKYKAWADAEAEKYANGRRSDAEYEVELLSRGRKYDSVARGEDFVEDETQFNLDELADRETADREYAEAKAFVENKANENDYAVMSPSHLEKAAKEGGVVLRLDHESQTFDIIDYDGKNGILTVADLKHEGDPRYFMVTADDIKEISENDTGTEEDAAGNVDADAQAPRGAGAQEGDGAQGDDAQSQRGRPEEPEQGGSEAPAVQGDNAPRRAVADSPKGVSYRKLFGKSHDWEEFKSLAAGKPAAAVDFDYTVTPEAVTEWEKSSVGLKVGSRDDAARLFERLSNAHKEIAKVLYLAKDGTVLKAVASIGDNGVCVADTPSRVKDIPPGTVAVIMSHNHPEGKTNPSSQSNGGPGDIEAADSAFDQFANAGVTLLDSIVTDTDHYDSIALGGDTHAPSEKMRKASEGFFSGKDTIPVATDSFNTVPYGERVDFGIGGNAEIKSFAGFFATGVGEHDADGSYLLRISQQNVLLEAVKLGDEVPDMSLTPKYAIILGRKPIDRKGIVDAFKKAHDFELKGRGSSSNLMGLVYMLDRATGKSLFDESRDVSAEFLKDGEKPTPDGGKKTDVKTEPKTVTSTPSVTSRMSDADRQKGLAALKAMQDILKAPVAKLAEGGIGKIYSGSRKDYATKNDDRIDNGPAIFAIGTGTGGAAYGWGLYGSRNKSTAEGYAGGKDKGTVVEQTWFSNRGDDAMSHLLGWSAPVSRENKKRIRDEWTREFYEKLPASVKLTSGATAYHDLERELGSNVEASMFLNRAGIDGINSGDLFVTFSADNIRVDHKWKDGEMQYAPVEPLAAKKELTKDEKRALRNATEDMVEALTNSGMGDFESVARFIRENSPEAYEKVKPYLKNAYNSATDGDVSSAQANEIYGKIESEKIGAANGEDVRATPDGEGAGNINPEPQGEDKPAGGEGDARQSGGRSGKSVERAPRSEHVVGEPAGRRGSGERAVAGPGTAVTDEHDGQAAGGDVLGSRGGRGEGDLVPSGERNERGFDNSVPRSESVDNGVVQDTAAVAEEVTPGFMRYKAPEDLPVKAPSSDALIVETSALASIQPPKIEKKPNIPDDIPQNGVLQDHQYHSVCQAVNAHEKLLPDGRRYGYFVADGTGCGKTRIIAGIMTDAMRNLHGNGRCLIVSQKENLFGDAKKDFGPFYIADKLFELKQDKVGSKSPLTLRGQGIAFTLYNRLAENYQGLDADGTPKFGNKKGGCLFADIVKWLGGKNPEDYDGVIAFDEAHTASKDTGETKGRSQVTMAQAVIDLQKKFPKARIVYLTATAAYDANNLRFLERMGLWGEGTGFKTRNDFVSAFGQNGENLSLMEVMTQGLKARGLYCARSISYKGVTCNRVVHKLTDKQKETHDIVRHIVQQIYDKTAEACDIVGVPKKQAMGQFGSGILHFFGSMMTSFKVETAIEIGKKAIADGKCPVFQLIETGAGIKGAKAKETGVKVRKQSAADELPGFGGQKSTDEAPASLRDKIIKFLNSNASFPSHVPIWGTDARGNPKVEGWTDEEVPEAAALRDELIEACKSIPDVGNPIDMLEDAFRSDGVSRVTGETPASKRGDIIDEFNNGKNRVMIFSSAGGTGASYHASRKFRNQRQRIQIPIEFGWKPDDFIQALGRSHRNDQVVAPEFCLLTTDLPGEMRFMSTIASRIASMGAIVGGDRNSSGQVVGASDSLDNTYGRKAIRDFGQAVASGRSFAGIPASRILGEMTLSEKNLQELDANKFLGRLPLLSFDDQRKIFDAVSENIATSIEEAKKAGEYDDGIKKIDAKRTVVKGRESMSKDDGAETNRDLLTVGEWNDSKRLSYGDLLKKAGGTETRVTFGRNKRSGNLFAFVNGQDGVIRQYSPSRGWVGQVEPMDYRSNFDPVTASEAKPSWDEQYGAAPAEEEKTTYYMSGDLFPVWNRIGVDRPQVLRGSPSNAKPFIGVQIPEESLFQTFYGFGQKERARKFFADNGYRILTRGGGVSFPIGEKSGGEQPAVKVVSYQGKRVMAVLHTERNPDVASYLSGNPNMKRGWYKDPNDVFDNGGNISFIPVSDEGAEQAYEGIVGKFGVFMYKGNDVRFASMDPSEASARRGGYEPARSSETQAGSPVRGGTFAESVGMPNMRVTVNGGIVEFHPGRGGFTNKDSLKRALGGVDAVSSKGKSYVRLDALKLEKDGEDWYYAMPLDKVPEDVRSQILGGMQRSPVEPLADMGATRVREALSSPDSAATAIMYGVMRAELAPLATENRFASRTDDELVQLALKNPNSFGAVGELYDRYTMHPSNGRDIKGMIRQIARPYVPKEHELEDIESNIWNCPTKNGGILNEIRAGNAELFKDGFQSALWSKARRFTKDFVRNGAKEAERIVHTDAKRDDSRDDMTSQLFSRDDAPTSRGVGLYRNGGEDARRDLASILDVLEQNGLPDKYLTWMRNYLEALKDVEAKAYTKFAVDFRNMHDSPSTKQRTELEGRVQKYVRDNVMKRLGELGKRPDRLFEYEFEKMLDGVRTFLATNNPIALPGDMFDEAEYTNEDLIAIMDEMGDLKMADICSLREKGMTGKQIAEEMGLKHDDVRQTLTRARERYGYHYDGGNAGGAQADWFDILGVPGEITRTEKSAPKQKRAKSNLSQGGFDFGDEKAPEAKAEKREPTEAERIDSAVDEMIRGGSSDIDEIVNYSVNVLGDTAGEDAIRKVVRAKLARAGKSFAPMADDTLFSSRPDFGVTDADVRKANFEEVDERLRNAPKTNDELSDAAVREFMRGADMKSVISSLRKMGAKKDRATLVANNAFFRAKREGKIGAVQDVMFAPIEPLADGNGIPEYAGFWNSEVDAMRKTFGMGELKRGKDTRKLEDIDRAASAMLRNEIDFERNLSVWASESYTSPVTAVEQAAINRYGVAKERELEALRNEQSEAYRNGNFVLADEIGHRMDGVLAKLDEAQRINRKIGKAWGIAGRARQMVYGPDMTLAAYLSACANANGGALPKDMRELASRLWGTLDANNVKLNETVMKDLESELNTYIEKHIAKMRNEDRAHRLGTPGAERIEREYVSAIEMLSYWAKKTGGVFQAIPNGQKLVRALERHHLLNGEGYTDGKPDAAKMVDLLKSDLDACGFEADPWEIRQIESRMGNAVEPSKDEIERSIRDIHSQMLASQQVDHIIRYGELPPKTGFIRDADSETVRELRRLRDRLIREKGLDARDEEGRIASALKALKNRIRNKNENVLKKIETLRNGGTIEDGETARRKITPDDELAQLQAEYEENKRILAELDDPDGSKALEKSVLKALRLLGDRKAVLMQKLAEAKADPEGYAWDRPEKPDDDPRIVAAREELESIRREMKAVKDSVFPNGTEKEIAAYNARRLESLGAAYGKWNDAFKKAQAETSWQAKWDALHPTKRRSRPESDEVKVAKANVKRAYEACLAFRRKLEREDTRGAKAKAWWDFLTTAPSMLRTIIDLSFAGVQSGRVLPMDPKIWAKGVLDGAKAFVSQKNTEVLVNDLRNHPYFEDFKRHGGHVYYMDGLDGEMPEDFRVLDNGVTAFGKKVDLSKIPLVRNSQRSFSGGLNRINLELYRCMVEAIEGGANDNVKADIANFINICTGYGYKNARTSNSWYVKVADALMWAPRKAVAELKFFSGYTFAEPYIGSRKSQKTREDIATAQKAIGRMYARFILGTVAFNIAIGILAWLLERDDNPNRPEEQVNLLSSDFGMWKIGNTRIDGLFGGAMLYRTVARLVTGKTRVNGVTKDKSRLDTATQYFRGKLNPVAGTAVDLATGTTFNGQPVDYSAFGLVKNYVLPITTSGTLEIFAKNDPLTATVLFGPSILGLTKYTAEEDILSRASDQAKDGRARMKDAVATFDYGLEDELEGRLAKREDAVGTADDILRDEKKVKDNEKKIERLRKALKGTPLVSRRKTIEDEIADLESENEELRKELPERRKRSEESLRGMRWDSFDRW